MALVDAVMKFTAIDIGSYGRNSDGGIFSHSSLGKRFMQNDLNFPEDDILPGFKCGGPLPYVALGDEAFPLLKRLVRPYPR